jgi:hypothetical protein
MNLIPKNLSQLRRIALAVLLASFAILDTTSISAQEPGRTITSPFGVANPYMNASDASESGSKGDTFVDPETGEVGHIIRNPFGVANPEGVDTGIDIPDDAGEEVGGIITSPFGVPASDDIDTGMDVFDEDEEYLISLPKDEESDVEYSEDVDEVDDETSDDAKEIEDESAEATTEKYVPVIDNPIPNREWDDCNFKLIVQSEGRSIEVANDSLNPPPTFFVRAGMSFSITVSPVQGYNMPSNSPTWYITAESSNPLIAGVPDLDSIHVPNGTRYKKFDPRPQAEYGDYLITVSNPYPYVQRHVRIKVITFNMSIVDPTLPQANATYDTLLATNIGDESESGKMPDYANWGQRENDTSLKKMTMHINLGVNNRNDFKIKMDYAGKPALNVNNGIVIDPNGIVINPTSNDLKDIFYKAPNHVYKDYTSLRNNSDGKNYLRVWTSSASSQINYTSDRHWENFGTTPDGNYLAPSTNDSSAYSMSNLFPGTTSASVTKDLYLEGINPRSSTLTVKAILIHRIGNGQYEQLMSQDVRVMIVEGNVVLNTTNDPAYQLNDSDHMIKDQHNGFQGWYYSNNSEADSTYGIENLFPFKVQTLSLLPKHMKYVVKIEGDQNPGVVVTNPTPSGTIEALAHLIDTEKINAIQNQLANPNTNSQAVFTSNSNRILNFLFGVYQKNTETLQSHISLYLCPEDATTTNGGLLLDNAKITFRPLDQYFEVWSSREPTPSNHSFLYPIDHSSGSFDTYKDATSCPGFANPANRNCDKDVLLFLHGFNVSELGAYNFHRYLFRKLYWTGYRNTYIGWCWVGNDKTHGLGYLEEYTGPTEFSIDNFATNIYHALQSSRSLCEFIENDLANINKINLAAHSLGNLVLWDAVRIHSTQPQAKHIENVISIEGAVWSDAFRDYDDRVYDDELVGCNITYTASQLERHSWSHWFRQDPHNALYIVNKFVNSLNENDYALLGMKEWNTLGGRDHFSRDNSAPFRTPLRNSLPEFAALLKKGLRVPGAGYIAGCLTNPIGLIELDPAATPDFDFHLLPTELGGNISNLVNIVATDYQWDTTYHNDMDDSYDQIYRWFNAVFFSTTNIILP